MSPQKVAEIVAVGTELIHDFPYRFRDAVKDQIEQVGWQHQLPLRPLIASLRRLGSNDLNRPDQSRLIRQAIPEVFEAKDRALGGLRAPVMLFHDIQRLTHIRTEQMNLILKHKALKTSMNGMGIRSKVQFDAASALDFIARLKSSVRSVNFEWQMGIPRYAVEQLVCLQQIQEEIHPAVRLLWTGLSISNAENYFNDLEGAARIDSAPEHAIPLIRAIRRIGGRYKPWGAVLSAMRSNGFDFWLAERKSSKPSRRNMPFLSRALVLPEAVADFDHVIFDPSAFKTPTGFFSKKMTQLDACDVLNLHSKQISLMAASGRLKFEKESRGYVFCAKDVVDLAAEFVPVSELAVRTGVSPYQVGRFMAAYPLVTSVYQGWSRPGVIQHLPDFYPEPRR